MGVFIAASAAHCSPLWMHFLFNFFFFLELTAAIISSPLKENGVNCGYGCE